MSISADLKQIHQAIKDVRAIVQYGRVEVITERTLEAVGRIDACLERIHRDLRKLDGELGHGAQLELPASPDPDLPA